MNNSFVFMAFSSGVESTEAQPIKRYIGVAPFHVLAVNPSKAELEKIYGTELENAPEYLGKAKNQDGTEGNPQVRIDFIVKSDAEKCGVELITKIPFFIVKEFRFNRDQTKVQVIDKYGRTAWVTKEQCQAHEIPQYANGPANLDKDYRPCYRGEEELTNFIKAYLNIPNVMKYVNNTWVMVDNPQDCEARLEDIEKYFTGVYTELRGVIALQPNNKVKALVGIRTTDDNRQFQQVYTQMFLKNNVSDYSRLDKDVQDRKANGAYPNTTFEVCDLKEYVVEPTNLSAPSSTDPFGSAPASPWGFN